MKFKIRKNINESIESYIQKEDKIIGSPRRVDIEKEDKVSLPRFQKELSQYPIGTYLRLSAKGNINNMNGYTYGRVKIAENKWIPYNELVGYASDVSGNSDQSILDLIYRKNIKNIGIILPDSNITIKTIEELNKIIDSYKTGNKDDYEKALVGVCRFLNISYDATKKLFADIFNWTDEGDFKSGG